VRVNTYAVALENMMVNRAKPVAPTGIVKSPKLPGVSAAALDKIPLVATATVTAPELVLAVLSMYKSNTVPLVAPRAAPSKVPVGNVITTAVAEVTVM
jgi:hypothetical protein